MNARSGPALAALFFLGTGAAAAQGTTAGAPAAEEPASWEFNASVYGYFPPEETPTVVSSLAVSFSQAHRGRRARGRDPWDRTQPAPVMRMNHAALGATF